MERLPKGSEQVVSEQIASKAMPKLTSQQEAGLLQIRRIDEIVNQKILGDFIKADPLT